MVGAANARNITRAAASVISTEEAEEQKELEQKAALDRGEAPDGSEQLMAQMSQGYAMEIQQDIHFSQLMADFDISDDARKAELADQIVGDELGPKWRDKPAFIIPLTAKLMSQKVEVDASQT
jgi:hypothetical protein